MRWGRMLCLCPRQHHVPIPSPQASVVQQMSVQKFSRESHLHPLMAAQGGWRLGGNALPGYCSRPKTGPRLDAERSTTLVWVPQALSWSTSSSAASSSISMLGRVGRKGLRDPNKHSAWFLRKCPTSGRIPEVLLNFRYWRSESATISE